MKMLKVKNCATGEIHEVFKSENHPEAKPGSTVWVDKNGGFHGIAKIPYHDKPYGFVVVGSKADKLFLFDLEKRFQFRCYLQMIDPRRSDTYPVGDKQMRYPGMPDYHFILKETVSGEPRLIILFDEAVVLSEGEVSDRFIIGLKPAKQEKESGEILYPYF